MINHRPELCFSVKQKRKLEYKASLKRACLNAWPGPTDKASWNKVINSEKCSPSALSCLQLANFVGHYKRVFSVFNSFLRSFYYKSLKPLLPYRLLRAHVQPVAISEIRRALRKIKRSYSLDGDSLSYRFFAYDCPGLLNHLQIFFQSCLAQSLVPDSFLCGCVTSIQKRGKDPRSTVSCFFSNLLEHLLLREIESNCDFTPFQFGFQKRFSCSHIMF